MSEAKRYYRVPVVVEVSTRLAPDSAEVAELMASRLADWQSEWTEDETMEMNGIYIRHVEHVPSDPDDPNSPPLPATEVTP